MNEEEKILGNIPDSWGPKLELRGTAVTVTSTGPNAIRSKAGAHLVLVMLTPQPTRHLQLNSDRMFAGVAPIGSLEIIPKDSDSFARWDTHKENLLAAFTDERLARLAGREFEQEVFELRPPRIGLVDAKALRVARSIQHELRAGESAMHEAIDAWVTILGVHVLREYSSLCEKNTLLPKGGLSPRAWTRVEEYMRANLCDKIRMEDLAEVAQLSPSHFSRSFRQTVGHSPHRYIMELRLKTARDLIASTNSSFEEISAITGFSSNSHMTATMRRFWGAKPMQFRRRRS